MVLRLHGTCVAVAGVGVLLRGPSGSGKSDLALRLIDGGALLVADDLVEIHTVGGIVTAQALMGWSGVLEVRGVGIVTVPNTPAIRLDLVVDLVSPGAIARLPEPAWCQIAGNTLPYLALAPFEASAPTKLRLAAAATRTGTLEAIMAGTPPQRSAANLSVPDLHPLPPPGVSHPAAGSA